MANIQQSVKWMKEGKKVRRKDWIEGGYIMEDGRGMKSHSAYAPPQELTPEYNITMMETLIAEDWEIFHE